MSERMPKTSENPAYEFIPGFDHKTSQEIYQGNFDSALGQLHAMPNDQRGQTIEKWIKAAQVRMERGGGMPKSVLGNLQLFVARLEREMSTTNGSQAELAKQEEKTATLRPSWDAWGNPKNNKEAFLGALSRQFSNWNIKMEPEMKNGLTLIMLGGGIFSNSHPMHFDCRLHTENGDNVVDIVAKDPDKKVFGSFRCWPDKNKADYLEDEENDDGN